MSLMWNVWRDGRITDAQLTAQNAYNKVNMKSIDIEELSRHVAKMASVTAK